MGEIRADVLNSLWLLAQYMLIKQKQKKTLNKSQEPFDV